MGPRSEPATYSSLAAFEEIVKACPDESFHEVTGRKGDVILMHPLMLHSASKNGRRLARTSSPILLPYSVPSGPPY